MQKRRWPKLGLRITLIAFKADRPSNSWVRAFVCITIKMSNRNTKLHTIYKCQWITWRRNSSRAPWPTMEWKWMHAFNVVSLCDTTRALFLCFEWIFFYFYCLAVPAFSVFICGKQRHQISFNPFRWKSQYIDFTVFVYWIRCIHTHTCALSVEMISTVLFLCSGKSLLTP